MENEQLNLKTVKDSGSNPWFSIWTSPRETISRIVTENPNKSIWLLAAIYGFSSLLNSFQSLVVGHKLGIFQIFFLALVLAPFWGYLSFSIWSFFVSITGKIFRGKGSFKEIRAAYAWSSVPLVINAVLWIILVVCFGQALFMEVTDSHPITQFQTVILYSVALIRFVTGVWTIVIYVNTLSEVQKFSVLKSIGNIIFSVICVGIVFCLIILGLAQGFHGTTATIF